MGRRIFVTALLLAAGFAPAEAARASCVAAVIVDGTVLYGGPAPDGKLPPLGGRRSAVAPACNDAGQDDPDGTTTVLRFRDIPVDVAVHSDAGDAVYLAE